MTIMFYVSKARGKFKLRTKRTRESPRKAFIFPMPRTGEIFLNAVDEDEFKPQPKPKEK